MANVYVYSGAGGAGTGADWANAYTTLAAAFTGKAAGDDFWVAQDHSEQAGAVTLLCPGTVAAPCRVICVNRAGSVPPVAADLATTAIIGTTGAATLTWTSSTTLNYCYIYGIIWKTGSAGNAASQTFSAGHIIYDTCDFQLNTTSTTTAFLMGGNLEFYNCDWIFGSASQALNPRGGRMKIVGGTVAASGTVPNFFWAQTSGTAQFMPCLCDSVDFSGMSGKVIVAAMNIGSAFLAVNCKTWSGATLSSVPTNNQVNDFIITDGLPLNYTHQRFMYGGTLTASASVYRNGGATDGTTPISWGVVTNANAKIQMPVEAFQIAVWNTATGAPKTATVQIACDNATALTNNDVWIELEYLGNASFPQSTMISNAPATVLTAATNIPATGSPSWTGTGGFASPQFLDVSVTFTPQMVGYVRAVLKVARASRTIYIDPVITVA